MDPCILQQEFDTAAFGIPFYRVQRVDAAGLAAELAALAGSRPFIVDAKVPAEDLASTRTLMELGFRRVCMQIELVHPVGPHGEERGQSEISDRFELPEETLRAHARNFQNDRFNLDPLLPRQGIHELYYRWIRNSLGGRKRVVHRGTGFCTFAEGENEVRIDLLSVLESGAGIGKDLIVTLVSHCRNQGKRPIAVVTECENPRAWQLYQRTGFALHRFLSVFHYVARCDSL